MKRQPLRATEGGRVDRSQALAFRFDGRPLEGYPGDTLASALLANGVRLVGRSFKYHRPRGLIGAGVEEPNALVEIGAGGRRTTNLRATEVELAAALAARSINRWPSLRRDLGSIANLFVRFLPAGFYYKTFIWPSWRLFEGPVRRAAGIGRVSQEADPDRYETRFAHCDVLVVGSGPAGLAAARAAACEGVRVMLVEQDFEFGGTLLWREGDIDGRPGPDWAAATLAALSRLPEVRLLRRATAIGYYDHNLLAVVERPHEAGVHERLWQIRATRVVLATGALERLLVFPGNDRPGVMLASAAQQYAARWGVRPGSRVLVFTNNDSAYEAARAVRAAGGDVVGVVDSRSAPSADATAWCNVAGIPLFPSSQVTQTRGGLRLRAARVRGPAAAADRWIGCDCLIVSGGWNPTVHLFSQSGGRLRYDDERACFRPDASVQAEQSAGGANGAFTLASSLLEGHAAGARAAGLAAGRASRVGPPDVAPEQEPGIEPLWQVTGRGRAFVDLQNDVTVDDVALAARENLVSVEHLKRYTTLGMAVDQGKTSNVNALAIMGELTGRSPAGVGTTRYRPPFTPTSLAAYGGRARGELFRPAGRTPVHDWHAVRGATFEEFGGWLRPALYLRSGEDHERAVRRECLAVRDRAGLFDGSPLGKIEVVGADAPAFLDRIYANVMSTLRVGRIRYGLMLNELGVVIDDGVVVRLGKERFLVSTTSGGAERIAAWLEEWLQCEWPAMSVLVAPVTSDWGVIAVTGPGARESLQRLSGNIDLSAEAFPHMSFRTGHLCGAPVRIARVSFTGEVSFEINAPADQTLALWGRIFEAGAPLGLEPVGLDAWMRLRTEKGYIHVGVDTDGQTIPADIGWGRVAARDGDFVGKRSLLWAANQASDRLQLVGLEPVGSAEAPPVGARLGVSGGGKDEGFVSSSGFSPSLGRGVAIGMVRGGGARLGEELTVAPSGHRVRVAALAAYDPDGERLRG